MTRRIIDIAGEPLALSLCGARLSMRTEDGKHVDVPIAEIESVLVSHPRATLSVQSLAELAAAGVSTVICDAAHRPTGVVLPIAEHGKIAARFAAQAALKRPVRKKLWRQVVRAKIRSQAVALQSLVGSDAGLAAMCKDVRSGDPTNVESQAAVRYWRRVFGDESFRRDPAIGGRNALLNYGYAVVRASVARAICGAGLHPALGIHHHSRGNPLCLADDLMEPFRPVIDVAVARLTAKTRDEVDLDRDSKRELLAAASGRVLASGERRTVFDVIERFVLGMAKVVDGEADRLWIPKLTFEVPG